VGRAAVDETAGKVASGSKRSGVAPGFWADADLGVALGAAGDTGVAGECGATPIVALSKLNGVWHFTQNSAVAALGEWHCGHSIVLAAMPVGAMQ